MSKTRLEAFSDGVIAILITIMVLEMKAPKGNDLSALYPIAPLFFSYVLSFVYIGIYWNNHHHMLQATEKVSGAILWANHHLLFWLSLTPFATAWMGSNDFSAIPTAIYGLVLLMCGVAYFILQTMIVNHHGQHSKIHGALSRDFKGKLSLVMYAVAVPLALYSQVSAGAIYIAVALMWLTPDPRIEKRLNEERSGKEL